jgi:hypothetical protein
MDDDANRRVYRKDVSGQKILLLHKVRSNPMVAPFHEPKKDADHDQSKNHSK